MHCYIGYKLSYEVDAEKNIVYACRPEGECEIHDVGMEQLENLSQIFNKMGSEGWELVQLFFRPLGIVSFWKRHSPSA